MKKINIINGPNLNLLGKREPEIYGSLSFEDYFKTLESKYTSIELGYFQSNHEGALLDHMHAIGFNCHGLIVNAGALTHSSIALGDAIAAITAPVVEVHISNIHARESFRHHSFLAKNCVGMIAGLGLKGYDLAIEYLLDKA